MDRIKDSFDRVRQDILSLEYQLEILRSEISSIKDEISSFSQFFYPQHKKFFEKTDGDLGEGIPTQNKIKETLPTQNPTQNNLFDNLKEEETPLSTGNEGVPTDQQTDQQTDIYFKKQLQNLSISTPSSKENIIKSLNTIERAVEILDSLDTVKKELRLKFKRLTTQEMLIFSTLYNLEDQGLTVDYKTISTKLNLTESSIRDYIGKLTKKGIPVDKKRINNKTISLSVSQNLRRVASLPTIMKLRDI